MPTGEYTAKICALLEEEASKMERAEYKETKVENEYVKDDKEEGELLNYDLEKGDKKEEQDLFQEELRRNSTQRGGA